MRILVDYRPALRQRTGVGEYVHELVRALVARPDRPDVAVWTSSWSDRPAPQAVRELAGAAVVDRRWPVRPLTWAWNRLSWPPVEWLAGACDVVHSQNPLLIPAARAAQVVTIHDLDFLHHPDRTQAEMRRDFPALVRAHAQRADAVIVSSRYAAGEVSRELGVAAERVHCCPAGAPPWAARVLAERGESLGRTILFLGTLEPRKNLPALFAAYARLLTAAARGQVMNVTAGSGHERDRARATIANGAGPPRLVLAGRAADGGTDWAARASQPPLAGHVELTGYVDDDRRRSLLADARMLVLPSLEEGFGLPVLEAMACGVPVVISNRGSLPEVAGDAAAPIDPDDVEGLEARMRALLDDNEARAARSRGLKRAAAFDWSASAGAAMAAYESAVQRRHAHRR